MKNPALYLCQASPPGSASAGHQRARQPGTHPLTNLWLVVSLGQGAPRVTSCPAQGLGGDFAFQAVACSEQYFLSSPGRLGRRQSPSLTPNWSPILVQIGPSPEI